MTSPLATCYCCGYHLGTLPDNERCPECGADAEYARRTLVERFPRPRHIREAYGWSVALLAILAAVLLAGLPVMVVGSMFLGPAVLVLGFIVGAGWLVSWAFLAANDPSVHFGRLRSAWSNLAVIVLGVFASIALLLLTVMALRDTSDLDVGGILLSGAVPVFALAQLCLSGRIATRLIALCHRRPRRVWMGVMLQLSAGLLCIAVIALTFIWILADLSNGNGRFPVTIPATITFYLALAVIVLTVLTLGSLCLALRHASRRYKANLAQTIAPNPAP